MEEPFDPYDRWLGISPAEQPPNHYRLLGINLLENDPAVIRSAAGRQAAQLHALETSDHPGEFERIRGELAAAQACLLSPEKKAAYDAQLWVMLTAKAEGWQAGGPPLEYHVKGAAKYCWVQAKRLWIRYLRLPAAYQALGESVYRDGRYRERLAALRGEFETVSKQLAARQGSASPQRIDDVPGRRGARAKIGGLLRAVATNVHVAMLGRRRRWLLRQMGQSAYGLDRQSSGPEHLTGRVHSALERLAQLRGEVAQLAVVPAGQLLSPRRLAWMLFALVLLPVLLLLWFKLSLLGIVF